MQISFKAQLKNATERIIDGYATTDSWDKQGEKLPLEVASAAFKKFSESPKICRVHGLEEFGRIDPCGCGGVGEFLGYCEDEKGIYISVKITDDEAWAKIQKGEYNGFSIGGFGRLNRGIFYSFEIIEISLVGSPVNGDCVFVKAKGEIMDEELKALMKSLLDSSQSILIEMKKMNAMKAADNAVEGGDMAAMGCKGCAKMQAAKGDSAPAPEIEGMKTEIAGLKTGIEEIKLMMNAAVAAKGVAFDAEKEPQKTEEKKTKASQFTYHELLAMTPKQRSEIEPD